MLAPHSPLRAAVTARAGLPCDGSAGPLVPPAPGVSADARTADAPTTPPPISPARSPPLWDTVDWDQTPADDPENGEPVPDFEFDQTVSW